MNYLAYQQLFEDILSSEHPPHPYDNEDYLNYTKLNKSRMNRWEKQLKLDKELIETVKSITTPQHWIIISEPWCGDAAHTIPFIMALAAQNANITHDIQLRDSEPYLIESYLTNGTKSIPKLIVRDEHGNDLFTWGSRPKQAQELMNKFKAGEVDYATTKINIQQWYNEDKGVSLCLELNELFQTAIGLR